MHHQLGGLQVNHSITIRSCDYANLRAGSILASLASPCVAPDKGQGLVTLQGGAKLNSSCDFIVSIHNVTYDVFMGANKVHMYI